jgi:hypothetical protein
MAVARPEFTDDEARALLALLQRQPRSDRTMLRARREMQRAVAQLDLLNEIDRKRRAEFSIKLHKHHV